MGRADYYSHGSHNVICDRCGFKYKHFDTKKEWTGLIVCTKCWEHRHPQDFVRGVRDQQSVRDPRPELTDTCVGPSFILDEVGEPILSEDSQKIEDEGSVEVVL